MTARFPTYRLCACCGGRFLGTAFRCSTCIGRRRGWTKNPGAPLRPSQEALRQGDPDLYRQALRGELD